MPRQPGLELAVPQGVAYGAGGILGFGGLDVRMGRHVEEDILGIVAVVAAAV